MRLWVSRSVVVTLACSSDLDWALKHQLGADWSRTVSAETTQLSSTGFVSSSRPAGACSHGSDRVPRVVGSTQDLCRDQPQLCIEQIREGQKMDLEVNKEKITITMPMCSSKFFIKNLKMSLTNIFHGIPNGPYRCIDQQFRIFYLNSYDCTNKSFHPIHVFPCC